MRLDTHSPVFVVGAGIMGAGIAQVAAQAGHPVQLFDAREGAADEARRKLAETFDTLVKKGKLSAEAAQAALGRIRAAAALTEAADAGLVIEAIVENVDAKRGLLRALEEIVAPGCVLASNTSSISITALANGLRHPGRLAGMHFFNPVALMKLVEVVSGLRTEPAVADAIFELSIAWGKTPVHARSTPGFIVNRIARPYYAETLALLHERAAEPAVLDACLRGAGFRMGPCELMDLIGHDTNFAVTESVFAANFGDKRYAPSLVQRELVDGGLLGRKSGRGFYDHAAPSAGGSTAEAKVPPAGGTPGAQAPPLPPGGGLPGIQARPGAEVPGLPPATRVVLHGSGLAIERWAAVLAAGDRPFERDERSGWIGLAADGAQLRLSDGRPASLVSVSERVRDVALFDLPGRLGPQGVPLAWSASALACDDWIGLAPRWLAAAGFAPRRLADAAGLVVARTVAMLVNEAADAVQQGVCTPEAADLAMKLGLNYPAGPFEWLARWDARAAATLLDHLAEHYRGERYRVSRELRRRAWIEEAECDSPSSTPGR